METQPVLGVVATVIAVVFYGSTYVPVRWFEARDGVFFQWVMSIGQMLIGIISYLALGCPPISAIAALGGVLFAVGNALTVFIMDGIGMAVGSLMWNTVTCIVGWAVSRFGLLGTEKMEPENDLLNVAGVLAVCLGGCLFAPIKHHRMEVRPAPYQEDFAKEEDQKFTEETTFAKRLLCLFLSGFVGFLYGNMLTPVNYALGHGGAPDALSHFFMFTVGTLMTSTVIMIGYSLVKRNQPFVNPELVIPSLASGIIYAIAFAALFVANQHLGQVIAYPIISKSPGIVTSLWAVVLFKEIRGRLNLGLLVAGITTTIIGVVLIALSKVSL